MATTNPYNPTPYLSGSSAGNPASSYGSSGGAQAGSYGTPAPSPSLKGQTYVAPTQSYAQQKATQGAQVQGTYKAPTTQQSYNYPTQQTAQTGYNYAPPQQASSGPTNWQAQANYYAQPNYYTQPQQPQQQQQQVDPNYNIWNPYAPKYNPQTGQYETPQQGGPIIAQQGQQAPGGMTAPPPSHDTNGYQSPQAVQPPASRYALPGWDNNKWNDPNNQDPKYVVGRILSNLPGRTDQMGAAVQRIAAAYPGTKQVGNGDISIPGVGVIDILMQAGTGGNGWWWGAGQDGGSTPTAAKPGAASGDPYTQLMTMLMSPQAPPAYQAPTPAPQTFNIATNPQYMALQKQLADLTAQQQAWQTQQTAQQAAMAQLQQQATTWQTEAAKARGNVNNPAFSYY